MPDPPLPTAALPHAVPPVAVSTTSTRVNRTGSWKYIRPVFQDKVAPCMQGCPVGIDIEGYMNLLREGRVEEARDLLLRENPMPAVTGRVCYHPCEAACNRREFDDAVAIHAVERALGDWALDHPGVPAVPPARGETVGIVGSGPAGLACAYHLARQGYAVTVYERDPEPGGILRYGIPEYRLPRPVVAREVERIRAHGVEIRCGVALGKQLAWRDLERHDAVFLAIGAHRGRSLELEGGNVRGVFPGLGFLELVNGGARPRLGRRVVVVGGGNTAMDCARVAARLGMEATVLYRRSREEMPAHADEVEAAEREGVRFEFLTLPVAVRTSSHGAEEPAIEAIESMFETPGRAPVERLSGLECVRMQLAEPDASGRRRAVPAAGERHFVPSDSVLVAVGEEPDLEGLPCELRGDGATVWVDELGGTRRGGVFAGGDLVDQPRTVADALGSGKRAAIGIDRFLRERAGEKDGEVPLASLRFGPGGSPSMSRWRGDDPVSRANPSNEVASLDDLNLEHFAHRPRNRDPELPVEAARTGFAETSLGLSAVRAMAEARRCFNCGVCNACELCLIYCPDVAISRRSDGPGFVIDYAHCKGCGVCAAECPRGAIVMTREGL